jgi:hypothetical protein
MRIRAGNRCAEYMSPLLPSSIKIVVDFVCFPILTGTNDTVVDISICDRAAIATAASFPRSDIDRRDDARSSWLRRDECMRSLVDDRRQ